MLGELEIGGLGEPAAIRPHQGGDPAGAVLEPAYEPGSGPIRVEIDVAVVDSGFIEQPTAATHARGTSRCRRR